MPYTVPLLLITILYSLIGYRVWHRDAPGFANTSDVYTRAYILTVHVLVHSIISIVVNSLSLSIF